jgi:hypothetical protein
MATAYSGWGSGLSSGRVGRVRGALSYAFPMRFKVALHRSPGPTRQQRCDPAPREALAVLRLFSIAAKRQAVTASFTRDLLDYFFRARHDKALRLKARRSRQAEDRSVAT